ncbi:MAG: single-stranded DNA-binding protein [Chitinophagaceae bacterium]|nr:single-stranded DNA-binding protein [Chitinophagaceae bacterium]
MIKMQVIGNLGRDCVVNPVGGKNVINFSVAHTEKYKDHQGNMQEKTTWVECSYWVDKTGISQYLTKGKQVYVEGIPDVRTYQKNDGTTGVSLTLRVRDIRLLGGRGDQPLSESPAQEPVAASVSSPVSDKSDIQEFADDLPF